MDDPKLPKQADPGRRSDLSIIQLLPNLMTVLAICAGVTAIRYGIRGDFERGVALIFVACILDALDGRFARMLKSESALGAELDSLADFVNFGISAPLLIYLWAMQDSGGAGWIAVLIFAVCCAVRLARFNVSSRLPEQDANSGFFVGVPAPAGAMLVLLPLFLDFLGGERSIFPDALLGLYMAGIGLLMISRIPTPSAKDLRVSRDYARYLLVGVVLAVGALLVYPWITLVVADILYAISLVWTWARHRRSKKA